MMQLDSTKAVDDMNVSGVGLPFLAVTIPQDGHEKMIAYSKDENRRGDNRWDWVHKDFRK